MRRSLPAFCCAALLAAATPLASQQPDGRTIAFWARRDSIPTAWLIGADGSGERRLTPGPTGSPQWSPDGREVRFAGAGADSGTVFVVRVAGGAPRAVAHVPGRSPRLSPDGTRVAFLMGPWTATVLAVSDTGGAALRPIAGGAGTTAWNAAWSPDGPRLAFKVSNGATHLGHIWVVDLASGATRQLAPHDSTWVDEVPAWFPDGKRIAFQSTRTGRTEIWVMNDDGTALRQVTK